MTEERLIMYVQITRGMGKGKTVRVLSRSAHTIEVMSPYGTEWTLNKGDFREIGA